MPKLSENSWAARFDRLNRLFERMKPVPEEWLGQYKEASRKKVRIRHCDNYKQLQKAWRHAFKWTDGLDCALSVMLASIASVKGVGDQIWIKIIGPASCGKSTLSEAVSVNTQWIEARSTIRGLHSGFVQFGNADEEDNSLIARLPDRTLVIKDADTLLQSPNLAQILSEFRDAYDSTSRTHYRNKQSKEYLNVRFTTIFCGTSSLRSLDTSELGQRFLDCVIMEGVDLDIEAQVVEMAVAQTVSNFALETDNGAGAQSHPSLAEAQGLTGGYIDWLRDNVAELLADIVPSAERLKQFSAYGRFVAYMRARPSIMQEETAEREIGVRLANQHARLAGYMAVVMNEDEITDRVMRRVRKVCLDTSRGTTLKIATLLYDALDGVECKLIAYSMSETEEKMRRYLRFLIKIGVVEANKPKIGRTKSNQLKYKLTDHVLDLYEQVYL